jgi:uncharacterized protein YnzC (UPF0291/DUF896 family)
MRVKKAEYIEGYKIKLQFNDNKVKIVDLEKELKGAMFKPLKDIDYFKKVSVDQDAITIVWPNGVDFNPDVLYEIGIEVKEKPRKVSARRKTKISPVVERSRASIVAKSR